MKAESTYDLIDSIRELLARSNYPKHVRWAEDAAVMFNRCIQHMKQLEEARYD